MAEDTTKEVEETEETEVVEKVIEEVTGKTNKLVPGMIVRVHVKIKEITPKGDERERVQVFEGLIIAKKGQDKNSSTITVRKVSKGFGVERIFPLNMPAIAKIELVKEMRVRRSKLYFTRDRRSRKMKEVGTKKAVTKRSPTAAKAKK